MNNLDMRNIEMTSTTDFVTRATKAYFRKVAGSSQYAMQPSNESSVETVGCRRYVVLRNVNGTLAVYRIRKCDQVLKGLKRWPKQFEKHAEWREK